MLILSINLRPTVVASVLMAKAKTKALKTEEQLAEALAPENEQTYPLPDNCVWVRLGSMASHWWWYSNY